MRIWGGMVVRVGALSGGRRERAARRAWRRRVNDGISDRRRDSRMWSGCCGRGSAHCSSLIAPEAAQPYDTHLLGSHALAFFSRCDEQLSFLAVLCLIACDPSLFMER